MTVCWGILHPSKIPSNLQHDQTCQHWKSQAAGRASMAPQRLEARSVSFFAVGSLSKQLNRKIEEIEEIEWLVTFSNISTRQLANVQHMNGLVRYKLPVTFEIVIIVGFEPRFRCREKKWPAPWRRIFSTGQNGNRHEFWSSFPTKILHLRIS